MVTEIPLETALQLCEEIRSRNLKKRFGVGKMQCWGCWKFGQEKKENGTPNLCLFDEEGTNRGCWQINRVYDQRFPS
ncbi:MAG: hypothetical protein ACFFBD_10430 [Candidatus Hodarchaeota archaeon]